MATFYYGYKTVSHLLEVWELLFIFSAKSTGESFKGHHESTTLAESLEDKVAWVVLIFSFNVD